MAVDVLCGLRVARKLLQDNGEVPQALKALRRALRELDGPLRHKPTSSNEITNTPDIQERTSRVFILCKSAASALARPKPDIPGATQALDGAIQACVEGDLVQNAPSPHAAKKDDPNRPLTALRSAIKMLELKPDERSGTKKDLL